jgi:CO/xanthine dehydrogenase Mo-binding subunit
MCTGPYEIPNVKVDSYAVYTNNIPNGAFRGFGGPQGAFAAETQMNRLAEALGMDPVEIRMRNVLHEGDLLSVGTPLPKGVSMPQVIEQCAEAGGWVKTLEGWRRGNDEGRRTENGGRKTEDEGSVRHPSFIGRPSSSVVRRGTGFAAAFKNVGFSFGAPEHAWATVELHGGTDIERVILRHAGADVGQGAHTVMAQMAAEALNVPVERVQMVVSDTAQSGNSGSASASRLTFMSGNSIIGACKKALEKWRAEERPAVGIYMYRPPATTPYDPQTGKSEPNFAYGYVAEVVQVDVDTDTGQVQILDVIAADDVGCAVNPRLVKGQIEGAVVQAIGYSILENFVQKNGNVQTQHLSTYLIPTVLDVPEQVQSMILEYPDPIGPYGARGMAEMPFLPLAPAVIAAVHDATGVWINEFPLTPERVLRHLRKSSNG